MPRFFFDVYDGREALRDEAGSDLSDVEEARAEAAALLPEFARETIPDGQSRDFGAAVRDEAGRLVYRAVLIFRGDTDPPQQPTYSVQVSGMEYNLTRSNALRQEARDLGARLTDNVVGLLALLDGARANVEAIRRNRDARRSRDG